MRFNLKNFALVLGAALAGAAVIFAWVYFVAWLSVTLNLNLNLPLSIGVLLVFQLIALAAYFASDSEVDHE